MDLHKKDTSKKFV